MKIDVQWTELEDGHDLWAESFCLYAYLHPTRDWLFYIGKADYLTVIHRLRGDHKSQLFRVIRHRYRVEAISGLHGDFQPEAGCRRSSALHFASESRFGIEIAVAIGAFRDRCRWVVD